MVQQADTLLSYPYRGKKVPELNDDKLREIRLHAWRIIYQIGQHQVHVVTVVHKRRDLQTIDTSDE